MNSDLEIKIHYHFIDETLLTTALTHRSASAHNNERLEYLGDAILNAVIADALFHQFPKAHEGALSRLRASLVSGEALAKLAREFNLGHYLHLGLGEIHAGGATRTSILSCALEAIVGAMYLDNGYLAAKKTVLTWYHTILHSLSDPEKHKDPKTQLQELLQAQHLDLPLYEITSITGEAHNQQFTILCKALGESISAQGASRRKAEQSAAELMLKKLKALKHD